MTINLYGISEAADSLIITEETGGQAFYEARETHPTWPGGASGVTIGCGYDCGYSSAEKILHDWMAILPPDAVRSLQDVAKITGSPARALAHELHWITVPWAAALTVYHTLDLPLWTKRVKSVLPNCDKLSGDCFGALVSLAFNRGISFDLVGARYAEMRAIKRLMQSQQFAQIPEEFLSMRRLWPEGGDLWRRRGHEAALFHQGLTAVAAATV